MDEIESSDSYNVASERLDRALARLEAGVEVMGERAKTLMSAESDRERLTAERNRLASELERTREKADQLDESAREVSLRLVNAMETVKTVLTK